MEKTKKFSTLKVFAVVATLALSQASMAKDNSFYCNGDLFLMTGDGSGVDVLNKDGESFELDSLKHEVVRASIDGKNAFIKIQPFAKVKWSKESEEFPARFKFTTDTKTWFAIEASSESDDTIRNIFCQRDR